MGNSQSPPSNSRYMMASRAFSDAELENLRSIFKSLAAQSQSNGQFITQSVFQGFFRISGALGERLFDLVTQKRKDGRLTFEDLIITKGKYEKGAPGEIKEFIYDLCDISGDGVLVRSELEAVLYSIHESIFSLANDDGSSSSVQSVMEVFINAATFSKEVEGKSEKGMSPADFRSWCNLLPSARKFLGSLLMPPDSGRPGCQVPRLQIPQSLSSDMLILRKEYAWHIGGALSQHEVEDWKLLYHSAVNGLSFTTFMGNISSTDGPTILIIRDTDGYVYGGYASQPWERHGDFYGDMKSFLFQLFPQASIYRPTGANKNLQWCAVNNSSDSIPNGIGFGGRANHFGLFISSNFDQGHTFQCTTFDSPCLAKANKIIPETIECWGVLANEMLDSKDVVKGTVLERFKEDRNMLKMVGLANSSD